MTPSTRMCLFFGLWGVAVLWIFGVEVYRGRSRNHSNWLFWLHVTAPLVSIVLMLMLMLIGLVIAFWKYVQA